MTERPHSSEQRENVIKILGKSSQSLNRGTESQQPSAEVRQKIGVLLDAQLRILSVSPSFLKMLGRREKDLSGEFFVSLIHKDDRADARKKMKDLFRPPYNCHVQLRLQLRSQWNWLEWIFRSELAEKGAVLAVIGAGRDLTEQKGDWDRFEVKVRKDETLARLGSLALKRIDLSEFFDTTCNLVAKALSADYVDILELLPNQERLLLRSSSCREDGWVGKRTVGFAENTMSGFCLMSKKPVFVEDIRIETRLSGSKVLLSRGVKSGFTTIIGDPDNPYGILGVHFKRRRLFFQDVLHFITAVGEIVAMAVNYRKAMDDLKASEEKYRFMVENINDVLFMTNAKGILTYISPVVESLAGFSPSEILGKHYLDFVELEDTEPLKEYFRQTLKGETGSWEFRLITKTGKPNWVRVSSRPFHEDGQLKGWRGTFADISERKTLEERLRQAQKMEAIGTLAGGIAHDFNNLLTTILGNVHLMLLEIEANHPLFGEIKDIQKAGEKAASLVQRILAFSRKQVLRPKRLNLNKVIGDLEKMLRRTIREDIEIETSLESDLWDVRLDPVQMEQVIMNLAVNARDAMPDGGKLTVETRNVELEEPGNGRLETDDQGERAGSYVLLAISDTGIGMDERTKSRVFDPFFTTKDVNKGTGLGLSVVHGLIKQSGGFIRVDSEPGKGTTFRIYLPKADAEVRKSEAEEDESVDRGYTGTETILLVEDDDMLRKVTRNMLQRLGYNVWHAKSGEAALKLLDKHKGEPIHLLLTDVVMPGMNGKELAERIKARRSGLQVVYMSGHSEEILAHGGVLEKDVVLIEKPFSFDVLGRTIRAVLGSDRSPLLPVMPQD